MAFQIDVISDDRCGGGKAAEELASWRGRFRIRHGHVLSWRAG